ncbi:hypothetical protein [Streptomyces griseus]
MRGRLESDYHSPAPALVGPELIRRESSGRRDA